METETSRVFVKGLPPTITESDLRKHFAAKPGLSITDVKCIPNRRIGYIGFKNPQEANNAVKYFHRTFIRMSKISVEPAKPVADPSLSNPKQTSHSSTISNKHNATFSTHPSIPEARDTTKKRKRDIADDEADPKLREYLSVMHNKRDPITDSSHDANGDTDAEPPTKIAAVAADEESDDEYNTLPTKVKNVSRKETKSRATPQSPAHPTKDLPEDVDEVAEVREINAPDGMSNPTYDNDDDWLRSRTNRLLDLVDDSDIIPSVTKTAHVEKPQVAEEELPNADADEDDIMQDAGEEVATTSRHMPEIEKEDALNKIKKTSRIFVRNLPYSTTEEDLRAYFDQFGSIEEVHVPSDASKQNRGMGFVLFSNPEAAVSAFQSSNHTSFQGRILHVLPASAKRDLDEIELSKMPLKKQNLIRKRNQAASSRFQWNTLFMSQDAVNNSVAGRLGIQKSELLDPTNTDAAVKQAIAETSTINDTKAFFLAHGINLEAFQSSVRGDTAILVKNFPYGTQTEELRVLFEEHGQVLRVLLPPTGVSAIVQYAQASDAKRAFSKLAYRRFKESVLFLEKAPKDLFLNRAEQPKAHPDGEGIKSGQKLSATELRDQDDGPDAVEASSIFCKNLSFETDTAELAAAFSHLEGYRSALVKTKKDPNKPGQLLSMGFGFVSFTNKATALAAVEVMNGHVLRGHKIQVRASHRGQDAASERKKEDMAKKGPAGTRIVIKNLAFQVTRKDLRSLLSPYGQLKSLRLPKKFNSSGRGFAFVDFVSPKEATSALTALRDTHLLGRRLVLEYAEADAVDPEEEIAKMQKKVGGQANKVAWQKLTGGGRKKITLGGEEEEGE
ncbi:hypothetical protein F5Y15DRAFT_409703 [Xylariaceae sp. FL0016]|nr:hypothetical protein F5Y15DRAFT_409703 [Xylariaceae sp. FL0016]